MAEAAGYLDELDPETAHLILKIQLDDIRNLQVPSEARSKGKTRDDGDSDAQMALTLLEQDLTSSDIIISDRHLSQSIANAMYADAEAIAAVIHEEEVAHGDRTLAHRLDGGAIGTEARVRPELQLPPCDLNEGILARLAGSYMSEDIGQELFKAAKTSTGRQADEHAPAEASTNRRSVEPSPSLRCISCQESKVYFDVVEVQCGHGYCKPCIQELVDLATKAETLFPLRCCRQPLDMQDIDIFLTKELKERLEHARVEFDTHDKTYCCRPTCSAFIIPDTIEGDSAICAKCGTATCVTCKKAGHDGHCPEDPELQTTLALADENGWQQCNACKGLIELETGCNHIT